MLSRKYPVLGYIYTVSLWIITVYNYHLFLWFIAIQSLFREETIGMALFGQYWMGSEHLLFAEKVLEPMLHRVIKLDHTLEV